MMNFYCSEKHDKWITKGWGERDESRCEKFGTRREKVENTKCPGKGSKWAHLGVKHPGTGEPSIGVRDILMFSMLINLLLGANLKESN